MAFPFHTILLRRGTAAEWTTADPVLAAGEFGYETDTGKLKIGDGTTVWTSLDYIVTAMFDEFADLTGTVNQITVTGGASVVAGTGTALSLPQDIHTGAVPEFAGLLLKGVLDIWGSNPLKWWNNAGTVQYSYIIANTSNHIIASVNVPFQLQYGALGSAVALSLDTSGNVVWNYDAANCDFSIRKLTAGTAYYYTASTDSHVFSGNVGLGAGATWGTDAVDVLSGAIATPPTTRPANVAQMYVANRSGVEGTASWHVMNEDGVTPYHLVDLYGEMYTYENAVEVAIDVLNQYHAVSTIDTTGIVKGWVFKAGSTGPIATFATYDGGAATLCTDVAHGLLDGEVVTICKSTNYTGKHVITRIDADNFTIPVAYVAELGGKNWIRGSSLQALPGSNGIYRIQWSATVIPVGANNNFKIESNLGITDLDNMAASARLTTAADRAPMSATGFATVADGDYFWLSVRNESDATNIIFRHCNLNVHKIG